MALRVLEEWASVSAEVLDVVIGICFDEANSLCPSSGESFHFGFEIWIGEAVLYRNIRRQCYIPSSSPGEHDKRKPS
ncbi:hypothetical protein GBA52_028824 [Prunus armeniaca]|nr:hypothetical protein GBA52_028824 [Prunus armeniaca]